MLTIYETDHQHSRTLCRALAMGCKSQLVPSVAYLGGPAAVYGILRGCGEIIRECEAKKQDYFHIDHGYVRRGHYDGYYRVSKNGLQWDGVGHYPVDRWKSLGIEPRAWKKDGKNIVVCPLASAMGWFFGINPHKWLKSVLTELVQHTDRPIVIRPKDGGDFRECLEDAWCVVAHQSNAAVDAILHGVPAIVLGPSAAAPVARSSLSEVENLNYAERGGWLAGLAYHQWTLDEMRQGKLWDWL